MSSPTISIGMPVYNGEKYLRESIRSLLSQTVADLELIIADNASTDATGNICAEVMREDPRVRYVRHGNNIGGSRNWNFVVTQARGPFFKWASSNDLYDPSFLEKCLQTLYEDRTVALCYSDTVLIDEIGNVMSVYEDPIHLMDPDPLARFKDYLLHYRVTMNNAQAGVIRTDVLRRTGLEGLYPHGDVPLMAELSLHGKFFRLAEPLFFRRMSEDCATPRRSPVEISQFVDPNATKPMLWRWPQCVDFLKAAVRAPQTNVDRYRAASFVLRTMNWRRAELGGELRDLWAQWWTAKSSQRR